MTPPSHGGNPQFEKLLSEGIIRESGRAHEHWFLKTGRVWMVRDDVEIYVQEIDYVTGKPFLRLLEDDEVPIFEIEEFYRKLDESMTEGYHDWPGSKFSAHFSRIKYRNRYRKKCTSLESGVTYDAVSDGETATYNLDWDYGYLKGSATLEVFAAYDF